jgi:hypothetical protein
MQFSHPNFHPRHIYSCSSSTVMSEEAQTQARRRALKDKCEKLQLIESHFQNNIATEVLDPYALYNELQSLIFECILMF